MDLAAKQRLNFCLSNGCGTRCVEDGEYLCPAHWLGSPAELRQEVIRARNALRASRRDADKLKRFRMAWFRLVNAVNTKDEELPLMMREVDGG